jgi:hypothetical protein
MPKPLTGGPLSGGAEVPGPGPNMRPRKRQRARIPSPAKSTVARKIDAQARLRQAAKKK